MYSLLVLATSVFLPAALVSGQQVGTQQSETHPSMTWQQCSAAGSCKTVQGSVTVDANWRWVHDKGGYTNCGSSPLQGNSIASWDMAALKSRETDSFSNRLHGKHVELNNLQRRC